MARRNIFLVGPARRAPFPAGIAETGAKQKEARQPIGRRAKFREETPVTRQNEEPNFTLTSFCIAQRLSARRIFV
jgi:hypothetical protein